MVKHTQTLCIEILLWLCLTILLGWRLKGYVIASMIKSRYIYQKRISQIRDYSWNFEFAYLIFLV